MGWGKANTKSVHELFVGMLHFLAVTLDADNHCICIRDGELKPADRTQFKHKHLPQMCIEDPFDRQDNVARSLTEASVKRVRLEFVRAFEIVSATGDFARLCQAPPARQPCPQTVTRPHLLLLRKRPSPPHFPPRHAEGVREAAVMADD